MFLIRTLPIFLTLSLLVFPPVTVQADDLATSVRTPLSIDTSTQKVPAGTMLTIAFQTPLDSRITRKGEPFTAILAEDFRTTTKDGEGANKQGRLILPAGSVVRGRVGEVHRGFLFSHGGAIQLAFDHIVAPNGSLLPLDLNLSTKNSIVNHKHELYTDPGIGRKVSKGVQDGLGVFEKIKEKGIAAGEGSAKALVTVPVAMAAGALAGAGVTTGKAAVAVVGKGEAVVIQPGDTVTIDFGGSFDLPSD